jgi:hypothetical protein
VIASLIRQLLGALLVLIVASRAGATSLPPPPPPPVNVPAPAAQMIPGNLVANGDFETGAFGPEWTLTPGGSFDLVCMAGNPIGAATCITHGGQYAMTFGLAGAQDSLSQNIPTVPGAHYVLTFYLANDNPLDQNTTTFDVFWGGAHVYSLASPQPSFPYRAVSLGLTATTNSTTLTFAAQHDPSQWFLDDISVVQQAPFTPVPMLTGWATILMVLLVAGVALQQIRRLARRR